VPIPKPTRASKSLDMGMEYNTGSMVLTTKANGITTRLRARELSGMPKEMFIEVNSRMTWPMDMENTLTSMDLSTRDSS